MELRLICTVSECQSLLNSLTKPNIPSDATATLSNLLMGAINEKMPVQQPQHAPISKHHKQQKRLLKPVVNSNVVIPTPTVLADTFIDALTDTPTEVHLKALTIIRKLTDLVKYPHQKHSRETHKKFKRYIILYTNIKHNSVNNFITCPVCNARCIKRDVIDPVDASTCCSGHAKTMKASIHTMWKMMIEPIK